MENSRADLLLHPVRLRIVQAMVGRRMTAGELGATLPDVPQATLYRQLSKLAAAGVLRVAEERQVRGAVEKVYELPQGAASLGAADMARATPDDHLRYFGAFMAALLDGYGRYLRRGAPDLERDMVGYRSVALYLSDEELAALIQALNGALVPLLGNEPAPGRRRRLLSTILFPDEENPS